MMKPPFEPLFIQTVILEGHYFQFIFARIEAMEDHWAEYVHKRGEYVEKKHVISYVSWPLPCGWCPELLGQPSYKYMVTTAEGLASCATVAT